MADRKPSRLLITLASGLAIAAPAAAIDPLTAINMANPSIFEWKIVDSCLAGVVVNHWIPVGWLDVSPNGHTEISGATELSVNRFAGVTRYSGMDTGAEARAFTFTNKLWKMSNLAMSRPGMTCSVQHAYAPPSTMGGIDSGDCPTSVSDALNSLLRTATLNREFISESYTSTNDEGWRSGCRDKNKVNAAVASNMRCSTQNMNNALQIGGKAAATAAADQCLGSWGSMYPRAGREIGTPEPVASAKLGIRALSTGRDHFGTVPYPVDTGGKIQQTMPAISGGAQVGQMPIPGAQMTQAKRTSWIYWRNVTCCVGAGGF